MKSKFLWMLLCSLLLTGFSSSADAQKVDFTTQIKPLLEKHCMECHNNDGDSYPIEVKDDAFDFIVEGDPEESDMYLVLVTDEENDLMPPADFERPLTDDQKELIKTWIAEGAEWPEDAEFVMWKPEESNDDADSAVADAEEQDEKAAAPAVDPRIYKAVGSLHPAILHLPMGLLMAAGLFALLSLRGNFVMSDCAYYCLWLGVFGAILACVSGWYQSEKTGGGTVTQFMDIFETKHEVYLHRLSALISTIFGLLLALFAMSARAKDPDEGATWKLGAIILAAGIGYVGMTGGKLVYPSNHYNSLYSLWTEITSGADEKAPAAVEDDGSATSEEESDDSEDQEKESGSETREGDLTLSSSRTDTL